jgi:hypothetical protein
MPIWVGPNGQPQPVAGTQVSMLQCPSDAKLDPQIIRGMAYTNYAGSEGFHWWPNMTSGSLPGNQPGCVSAQQNHFPQNANLNGLFTITWTNRIADVTDGTSNTVGIAEVNSTGYKWAVGGLCINATGVPRFNNNERVFRAAFVWTGIYGQCCQSGVYTDPAGGSTWWFPAGGGGGGGGGHAFSPTYITAWGVNNNWPGASSLHPSGLNTGRVDGSVHFVAESIEWGMWAKLNAIKDNYPIDQ